MEEKGLTATEVAIVGSLLPETVDQARSYVESLTEARISDLDLQELLDELAQQREMA
jgi:hypothetical protein